MDKTKCSHTTSNDKVFLLNSCLSLCPSLCSLDNKCTYIHIHVYLLIRLVSSNKSNAEGEYCTFCIRTGTSKGVVNRVFRAECERDLTLWARGLVTGTHNCVVAIREVAWGIKMLAS